MKFKLEINLYIIIIIGLLFRLLLIPLPGFQIDVNVWFAWAERLNQTGFANFYSDQIWTNYTPGYLYILGFLGFIKNLFLINDSVFTLILKLPSIVAEIILGIFIYKQLVPKSFIWATMGLTFILFNPVFIFNSSVWGQIDGLFSLALIMSIYFLNKGRLIPSTIFLSLGFLIKPQAIALLPLFALFLIRNFSVKNLSQLIIPFLLTVFSLSLPFFINQPFSGLPKLFSKMVSDYSFTSLYAYNFWGMIGFWIPDNTLWSGLSYQTWGYILLASYWIVVGYLYFKKKLSVYALATLATLGFFFLPTRVHERYLYPAIVFLILLAAYHKSRLLLILSGALTFLHLLNLYYVYVYYNEFYLRLPKMLYNPIIYNFLDTNNKGLSLISTIIFILIIISIIKYGTSAYQKS